MMELLVFEVPSLLEIVFKNDNWGSNNIGCSVECPKLRPSSLDNSRLRRVRHQGVISPVTTELQGLARPRLFRHRLQGMRGSILQTSG